MEWEDIVGYEGYYQINEYGVVKSLPRVKYCGHIGAKQQTKERFMSQINHRLGYVQVKLSKDGKSKMYYVHRLVALTFIDNDLSKKEVNHKDGNKKNNHVDNLEWTTRKENMEHASLNGLVKRENASSSYRFNKKIDMDIARGIRNKRSDGGSLKEISDFYSVSLSTVSMICNNKIWREDE